MGNKQDADQQKRILEIHPGIFYNVRASFKLFSGILDIGTHMSLIRLKSGKFLVIDTVPLDFDLHREIDLLTESGTLIEAIVATHPFHTLAFPEFYAAYPNVPFYGTPRHLREQKKIPWKGDVNDIETRCKWEPEVQMRIPDGAEFVAPVPESFNHFSCVWVYCPEARTIHVDDCINYFETQSGGVTASLLRISGKKGGMEFHMALKGPGLHPTTEAPVLFKKWVQNILQDWDFDNACCAHLGNKIGGAHKLLAETLQNTQPILNKLVKTNSKKKNWVKDSSDDDSDDGKDCASYNVMGNECG